MLSSESGAATEVGPEAGPVSWGVRRLLAFGVAFSVAAVLIVQCALGYLMLREYTYEAAQAIEASVASNLANQVVDLSAGSMPLAQAFHSVYQEVQRLRPESVLVLAEPSGNIITVEGRCSRITDTLDAALLAKFQGPTIPQYPVRMQAPCAESLWLLSVGKMFLPERNLFMVMFGVPSLAAYINSFDGLLGFALCMLPVVIFLSVTAVAFFYYFKRSMLRYAETLLMQARRFAEGDRSVRFKEGDFQEFNELAAVFNRMASEEEARLLEIEQDDTQRRHMMASIVHDLRTPLTAIEGCIELLRTSGSAAERSARYFELITGSVQSQQEIAENLKQLARFDAGSISPQLAPVDAAQLAANVAEQLQPVAERKSVSLHFASETGTATVEADAVLLRRTLLNLLSNAIRYTPNGGSVRLSVRPEAERVMLEIADTGVGISPEDLPQIFKEFFRTTRGAAEDPGGTGLGLAIVDRVARMHRAKIYVASKPGEGSIFRLHMHRKIPEAGEEEESVKPKSIPEPRMQEQEQERSGGLRIMLYLMVATNLCTGALTALFASPLQSQLLGALVLFSVFFAFLRGFFAGEEIGNRLFFAIFAWQVMFVASISNSLGPFIEILLGFAVNINSLSLIASARTIPRAIVAVISILLQSSLLTSGFRSIGMSAGLWIGGTAFSYDRFKLGDKLVTRPATVISLCAVFAALWQSIAIYYFAREFRNLQPRVETSVAASTIAERIENLPGNKADMEELLALSYFVRPFSDYLLFNLDGSFALGVGMEASVQFPRINPAEVPEHGSVTLAGSSVVRPLNPRSVLEAKRVCNGPVCYILGLHSPGLSADRILNRRLEVLLVRLIVIVGLGTWVLFALPLQCLGKSIDRRFRLLSEGLERYRQRDYSMRIGLRSNDEIGELVTILDRLAERLPHLSDEVERRNKSRRMFLERCGNEVWRSAASVGVAVKECAATGGQAQLKTLSESVSEQRLDLESLFELSRLELGEHKLQPERLALDEVLMEEMSAANKAGRVQLSAEIPEEPLRVNADADQISRILRYFLHKAVERSGNGSVRIAVEQQEKEITVIIKDDGRPIAPSELSYLLNPVSAVQEPWEPNINFRGYSVAVFARHLSLMGGHLELRSGQSEGLEVSITLLKAR